MAFVGTKDQVDAEQLENLIKDLFAEKAYFSERRVDKVTAFAPGIPPNFSAPQGQIFNQQRELRWKKTGKGFSILLLSLDEPQNHNFKPLKKNWKTEDRNAHLYDQNETRFPKGVHTLSAEIDKNNFTLGQRYFQDAETATIHFIALTLIKPL